MSQQLDTRALAAEIVDLIGARPASPLLSDDQAAELLNVPASWLGREARAGRVPHVRLGHYRRYQRDELLAWVDKRVIGPR
jgi:excisionase family DNA binding protein